MTVFTLPPRGRPAVTVRVTASSAWPSRLLVLGTVTFLALALFVAGRRFGADVLAGMSYADVTVLGLVTLWTPLHLVLPLIASRRGGAR